MDSIFNSVNHLLFCFDYPKRTFHQNAVVRAFTGAQLALEKLPAVSNSTMAAAIVGSTRPYVVAAMTLLQSEDYDLVADTLTGCRPLLATASDVRHRARLIADYRAASQADLTALAHAVGVGDVWDRCIAPHV